MIETEITLDEELPSAAKSRAYLVFAEAIEYPDEELYQRIIEGGLADELMELFQTVNPALLENIHTEALRTVPSLDEMQIEHTRLFDGAAAKNPCQLYGSSYVSSRDKAVEEPLRFYDFFGLKLSESAREFPDYLGIQLEFLHYLAFCQSGTLPENTDIESYEKAEQDFLARHPNYWLPKLMKRLKKAQPSPYYAELMGLLKAFLESCLKPNSLLN